jgi:hypothetical protein
MTIDAVLLQEWPDACAEIWFPGGRHCGVFRT